MQTRIPRPEHPRPDFERCDWLNLNGEWEFEIDTGDSGESRGLAVGTRFSKRINVPFCPESPLSGVGCLDFMDAVWYRRRFTVSRAWQGRRVLLHFGAVDYDATVWVNGTEAGRHRGGFTQFTFDVTEALRPGANEVVVRAVDRVRSGLQPGGKQSALYHSHGCSYRRTTGIWQTVWLDAVGETYLERVVISPDLDSGRLAIQADVRGPVAALHVVVCAGKRVVAETVVPAVWRSTLAFIELPEVRAWSPEDPFLYDVFLTLRDGDKVVDVVQTYTGFRKIYIDGNKVYLNNKVLFQRLVLDQGFYPDGIMTAPTDRALQRDIKMAMAMGFDGARLHQKVFEPRFLYWADRLGYLCWGEYPDWGCDHTNPAAMENLASEWVEELQRDRNHPCIVGWCPTNETPTNQRAESVALLYKLTRAIDPSRPIIDTSGYVHVATDIDDNHDYTQTPAELSKRQDPLVQGRPFRNFPGHDTPHKGQPFICSEYGGIWWNPGQRDEKSWGYGDRPRTEKAFIERFRGLTEALLKNPGMSGLCYTQLTDVEQEVNGLYTFQRKAKFDPKVIAAILRQQAAIE
ncbi:MAG: beta-galactosidase [Candidatus Hydrogenedentes bacterium]|nr:beta-galactosidase [Candidatus Hydrogenedentota bacterium]